MRSRRSISSLLYRRVPPAVRTGSIKWRGSYRRKGWTVEPTVVAAREMLYTPRYPADPAAEMHSHVFRCISVASMVQQNYVDGHSLYHLLDMSGKEFVSML